MRETFATKSPYQDYAEQALSKLVTVVIYVLAQIMALVQYGLKNYPEATRVILMTVGAYLAYKFARRLMTMWWSMMLSTVRFVFYGAVVVTLVSAYFRGFNSFFSNDVPALWSLWNNLGSGRENGAYSGYSYDYVTPDSRLNVRNMASDAMAWASRNQDKIDYLKNEVKAAVGGGDSQWLWPRF